VGVVLLRLGLVDCEGWDVFSLWAKRRKLAQDWKLRGKRLGDEPPRKPRRTRSARKGNAEPDESQGYDGQCAAAARRVHTLIERGEAPAAVEAYREAAKRLFEWPAQPDLYAMIKALHARGAEVESIPLMRDHCRSYPESSDKVTLKLSQLLIRECQRPAAATRLLQGIRAGALPAELERARLKLLREAERCLEEGAIEVESDD
jgi:hypothetical protein